MLAAWDHEPMKKNEDLDTELQRRGDARDALIWLGARGEAGADAGAAGEFTRSAVTTIDGLETGVRILTATRLRQAQLQIARPDARVTLCVPDAGENELDALKRAGGEQGVQWAVMSLHDAVEAGLGGLVAEAVDVGVLMPAPLQAAPAGWSLESAREREHDNQLTTDDVLLACEAAVAEYLKGTEHLEGHVKAPVGCLATGTEVPASGAAGAGAADAGAAVRVAVNVLVTNGSRTLRQRAAGRIEIQGVGSLIQAQELGRRAAQALLDAGAASL